MSGQAETTRVEYRPNRRAGFFFAGLFAAAACVLLWLGTTLTGDAAAAMDGFTRILFTAVPIRPFAWTMALVFLVFAIRIGVKTVSSRPTLILSDSGLRLPDGRVLTWSEIESAAPAKGNHLEIKVRRTAARDRNVPESSGWRSRILRTSSADSIALSAFDLGASPNDVAAAIARQSASHAGASTERSNRT